MNSTDKDIARISGCFSLLGWRFVPASRARDGDVAELYWLPGGCTVKAEDLPRVARLWVSLAGGEGVALRPKVPGLASGVPE